MPILPPSDPRQGLQLSRIVLTVDHHRLEFSELSGADGSEHRLTPPTRWSRPEPVTIVLTRAAPNDFDMVVWSWHQAARTGERSARRDCSLELYGDQGQQVAKYLLSDAWPILIELEGVRAGGAAIPIERITIQCESIQESRAI